MTARLTVVAVAAILAAAFAVLTLQHRAWGALFLIAITTLAVAERVEARG